MKFCCEQFKLNIDLLESRGSRFLPIENEDYQYWGIIYRNYDYQYAKRNSTKYKTLTVEKSGGIKFCPYCGFKLSKYWKKNKEELREIIKKYNLYNELAEKKKD